MNNFTFETINKNQEDLGLPYLKLLVDSKTEIALPMADTQEVLTVSVGRITPIPNMNKSIVGLINQRNRVFWVVDLSIMLGLSTQKQEKQQYSIVIINVDNVPLGLLIEQIQGVIRIPEDNIQSPVGNVSANLIPYLQGCILNGNNILSILAPTAILNRQLTISN